MLHLTPVIVGGTFKTPDDPAAALYVLTTLKL